MALGATKAMADSRTNSLGLTAGQQIDDLDGIWMYPQDAARFGNVADFRMASLGSSDNWFGVIHKDWDDIGYLGIYTNRPFNQSFGWNEGPSANQNGILDGWNTWDQALSPFYSAYDGTRAGDPYGHVDAHYDHNNLHIQIPAPFNNIRVQDPENKLDLFWAKDFTDATFGVHFNYAAQDGNNGGPNNGVGYGSTNGVFSPAATAGTGTNISQTGNMYSGVLGLDLGLGLKNVGVIDSLDLAAGYSLGMVDYKEVNNRENPAQNGTNTWYNNAIKDDNISEIRANVLAKLKVNDTTTSRIFANAKLGSLGLKQTFLTDTNNDGNNTDAGETTNLKNSYSDTNINLGFACDHNVADGKAHVIASVSAIYDGRAWKQSGADNLAGSATADQLFTGSGSLQNEDWWVVPVNVAVEAPLFPWLKARIGASHNLFQQITTKVVQKTNINAGGTAFQDTTTASQSMDWPNGVNMTMGVGATFENFSLDMEMNEQQFENYLTTFQPGAGIFYAGVTDMFWSADVRYAF